MSTIRHYLALDQATKRIGFAIGSANMIEPVCGHYEPPSAGARHGVMLGAVRDWLDTTIKTYHIHKVCFETPFSGLNPRNFGHVCKMVGVIELVCDDHDIPCVEATPPEWRKRFIDLAQAPREIPRPHRRNWLKMRAMEACFIRKWHVKNHDEAEAAGILNYVLGLDYESYNKRVWNGRIPD
jgi:Holliday junction resolvasome RuvABC endonuclease subunit